MVKYILIGGSIHKAPDGGKSFCEEMIKDIDHRPIKILDCLFARSADTWEAKFKDDQEFFSKNMDDFELELASSEKFMEQVSVSDIIFFQGGNPHQLMSQLDPNTDWLKEFDEKVLVGSSGGADAIVKYYSVGKTSNIGEGMGFLPIKFIPHWKSADYAQGFDIDWQSLLKKLTAHKEDLETVTISDGDFAVFER